VEVLPREAHQDRKHMLNLLALAGTRAVPVPVDGSTAWA
jgi:hypothetical protein